MSDENKQEWAQPVTGTTEKQSEEKAPETPAKAEEGKEPAAPQVDVASTPAYKSLQTKLNRANEELTRARAANSSLSTIESRTAKVEQILEAMVEEFSKSRESDEDEAPVRPNLKQRYEAIKGQTEAQRKAHAQQAADAQEIVNDILEMAQEAGIDPQGDEFAEVWKQGTAKEGRTVARRLVSKKQKEGLESKIAKLEAKLKEINGDADSVDTSIGTSRGKTFTREHIARMSDEEYQKNRADILAAQVAGRIK